MTEAEIEKLAVDLGMTWGVAIARGDPNPWVTVVRDKILPLLEIAHNENPCHEAMCRDELIWREELEKARNEGMAQRLKNRTS